MRAFVWVILWVVFTITANAQAVLSFQIPYVGVGFTGYEKNDGQAGSTVVGSGQNRSFAIYYENKKEWRFGVGFHFIDLNLQVQGLEEVMRNRYPEIARFRSDLYRNTDPFARRDNRFNGLFTRFPLFEVSKKVDIERFEFWFGMSCAASKFNVGHSGFFMGLDLRSGQQTSAYKTISTIRFPTIRPAFRTAVSVKFMKHMKIDGGVHMWYFNRIERSISTQRLSGFSEYPIINETKTTGPKLSLGYMISILYDLEIEKLRSLNLNRVFRKAFWGY